MSPAVEPSFMQMKESSAIAIGMSLPVIVSTWSFGLRGNAAAWPGLARGGSSLDAVEAACAAVDADGEVDSVGYGGLPDSSGRVSLDGSIMLAPAQCGSVCFERKFLHPVSIARRVMERTGHVMLAGDGAEAFALEQGFKPAELLAPAAKATWEAWKSDPFAVDQTRDRGYAPPRPVDRGSADGRGSGPLFHGDESAWKHHDTIGVLAIDLQGVLAGACSTSGTPYKLPGRVGDSPIIGHGLYVDPRAGAATATGAGELIMGVCGSFLCVELMRQGLHPRDAAMKTLERIATSYDLKPHHQVAFLVMRPDGAWASAALRPGYKTSIRTPHRDEAVEPDAVLIP
jgi:N4-(beta-N-acetylglucosaminyl)-L-asparaginase